jgi:hypothetical protein
MIALFRWGSGAFHCLPLSLLVSKKDLVTSREEGLIDRELDVDDDNEDLTSVRVDDHVNSHRSGVHTTLVSAVTLPRRGLGDWLRAQHPDAQLLRGLPRWAHSTADPVRQSLDHS